MRYCYLLPLLLSAAISPVFAETAQAQSTPNTDHQEQEAPLSAEQQAERSSLQIDVGAGLFATPAFIGSKDYQLSALPSVSLRYKDKFFFSIQDGLGFDLIQTDRVQAGPVVRYQPKRKENGDGFLRIAGDRTEALRGLGDVGASAEVGGFVQYQFDRLTARVEVRKQTAGAEGVIGNVSLRYTQAIPSAWGRPIILTIGPRATIVDDKYNAAYFGVTPLQSARSGLAIYKAGGGLLSAGVGAGAILPIAKPLSAFLFAGYDRVAGDAARSPLVKDRGSRNQGSVGLGLTYHFKAF